MQTSEQRLRSTVEARLEPDETFLGWTRAWVSRYRKLHWLLSLRNRDFAVVTDRRLMLWSAGFFTRRPRRRVLAERLDELTVESISRDPGRKLACRREGRKALLLELGTDDRSDRFWLELRDRARYLAHQVATEASDAEASVAAAEEIAAATAPDAVVVDDAGAGTDGAPARAATAGTAPAGAAPAGTAPDAAPAADTPAGGAAAEASNREV